MAGGAVAFRLCEVVDVHVLGGGARDDLVPLDGLDVAEVVVVQDPHRPVQDVYKYYNEYLPMETNKNVCELLFSFFIAISNNTIDD